MLNQSKLHHRSNIETECRLVDPEVVQTKTVKCIQVILQNLVVAKCDLLLTHFFLIDVWQRNIAINCKRSTCQFCDEVFTLNMQLLNFDPYKFHIFNLASVSLCKRHCFKVVHLIKIYLLLFLDWNFSYWIESLFFDQKVINFVSYFLR
jgi:hypothetical protein